MILCFQYLRKIKGNDEFLRYMDHVHYAKPKLMMYVRCYHTEIDSYGGVYSGLLLPGLLPLVFMVLLTPRVPLPRGGS